MRDMPGLRLQEKQEIAIFLRLVIIWENTFLNLGSILEVAGDFILLQQVKSVHSN